MSLIFSILSIRPVPAGSVFCSVMILAYGAHSRGNKLKIDLKDQHGMRKLADEKLKGTTLRDTRLESRTHLDRCRLSPLLFSCVLPRSLLSFLLSSFSFSSTVWCQHTERVSRFPDGLSLRRGLDITSHDTLSSRALSLFLEYQIREIYARYIIGFRYVKELLNWTIL